jgi:hypothetical protein
MSENIVAGNKEAPGFLLVLFSGALLATTCFIVGAWVMFKGKSAPGEGFIRTPKGQVFSIPEAEEAEDFPDEDKKVVAARSEKFLANLLGGEK